MKSYRITTTHGDWMIKAPNPILAMGAVMNQNPEATIVELKRLVATDIMVINDNFELED